MQIFFHFKLKICFHALVENISQHISFLHVDDVFWAHFEISLSLLSVI